MIFGIKLKGFDSAKFCKLVPSQTHGPDPNNIAFFGREGVVLLSNIFLHSVFQVNYRSSERIKEFII